MSERKEIIRPKKLVEKYGEDFTIWSYSRLSTFKNCQHEYYLSRILKKENENNYWAILGGLSHDALEDFYNGKIKYDDMLTRFEHNFLDYEMSDLKFVKDEAQNERMIKKYKDCMVHFFKNHHIVPFKVISEREVWIDLGIAAFIGYIDAIHKDEDGNFVITDYKTSSMGAEYKGENLLHKQEQLLLYALALHQMGVPLDKIKIRWNFLKYTNINYNHMINVTYLKNGKHTTSCVKKLELISKIAPQLKKDIFEHDPDADPKEVNAAIKQWKLDNDFSNLPQWLQDRYTLSPVVKVGERHKWVESIKTQLKKDLIEYGLSDMEAEIMYLDCVESNSLDGVPVEVFTNYVLQDAYVYGEVNQENIDRLIDNMTKAIKEIQAKGIDDSSKWEDNKTLTDKSMYYCNNLCGVRKECRFYQEHIEELKKQNEEYQKEDIDILTELENL